MEMFKAKTNKTEVELLKDRIEELEKEICFFWQEQDFSSEHLSYCYQKHFADILHKYNVYWNLTTLKR